MFALLGIAFAHVPILYVFGPDDDWCGFLNQTATSGDATFYPGDVIILRGGEYERCAFTALVTDTDTEFTILQAENPDDPPRFVHDGADAPMLDISGTHLFIYDVSIEGVPAGGTGIRLADTSSVWMRFSTMSGIAGTGLRVEGTAEDVWVLDDRFETEEGGTALELGCVGCVQQVRVRDDIFSGAGTGVRAESGVTLEVSDSVFVGTTLGVSLSSGSAAAQLVSGNLVLESSVGIDVRGGPAVIRNNIVRGATPVRATDDASGDFAGIRVLGNTFAGGTPELDALVGDEHEITDNAGIAGAEGGNVPCDAGCFRDPDANDFYPEAPLRGAGVGTSDDALFEDFCGQQRVEPRTSGALQWVGEIGWDPLEVGFKADFQCSIQGPPGEQPDETGFEETDGATGPKRCGCASVPQPRGLLALLLIAMVARSRRTPPGNAADA